MPSVPRICFVCGKRKYKFKAEKGYRWLCPDPKHEARVKAKKRRISNKNRRNPHKRKFLRASVHLVDGAKLITW